MAWTFVRHLGREQDCYGRWWVRSVWQDGLGGERCEHCKWNHSPTNAEITASLTSVSVAINTPPEDPPEVRVRKRVFVVLRQIISYLNDHPAIKRAFLEALEADAIPDE
jgi:hypothetical protein